MPRKNLRMQKPLKPVPLAVARHLFLKDRFPPNRWQLLKTKPIPLICEAYFVLNLPGALGQSAADTLERMVMSRMSELDNAPFAYSRALAQMLSIDDNRRRLAEYLIERHEMVAVMALLADTKGKADSTSKIIRDKCASRPLARSHSHVVEGTMRAHDHVRLYWKDTPPNKPLDCAWRNLLQAATADQANDAAAVYHELYLSQ